MSSEIRTMSELQRNILHLLMDGWQTMDQGKQAGMVRLDDVSETFGLPPEVMRKELALLEAFGYVDNVHSMGMDQQVAYVGTEQSTDHDYDPGNPTYFITENGKRLVISDVASDEEPAASPA